MNHSANARLELVPAASVAHSRPRPVPALAPVLSDGVEALGRRYLAPISDATLELEAELYAHHPGRRFVPFYLWLSIRGHGQFERASATDPEVLR